MELTPSSSSSSSSSFSKSKSRQMYDVFINFRGEDTCSIFVSHLYSALSKAGVNTFLDKENLLKETEPEDPEPAIERSQIAIVVFSETFTESTWCLEELAKIIEYHVTHGLRVIMPVFYEIDPSDVRHQSGDSGKALKEAAVRKFSGKRLEYALSRWSGALTKAANLSGFDTRMYRNDSEVVEEIVKDVLTILGNEVLSTTEFPVGLESRVQQVIRFIENRSTQVCMIGIWGMGGSGKTTFAKAIYDKIHRRFTDKSFIENIRESIEQHERGHVFLQEQLLLDVLKTKVKIHSVGMGTTMIENRLAKKSALIVLDDVTEFNQLKSLCGNGEWIGQGSVLMVTTRDLRLLNILRVDYVYEMDKNKMDDNESLELFSYHAFGEAKPTEDFNELARNVVAYCGGLPLALEVIGSYLSERTKKEWESVLSKLKIIPNDQVQEKLRISFDSLNDSMEKEIFLDVCCFFVGKDRNYVTEILNDCGLYADIGITILIERSLVKIEKKNKLGMHPLLQQMGREIVRESSIDEPEKRSRLWLHSDVLQVLTENIGTNAIEGLTLKSDLTNRDCFEAHVFQKMKRLRLLQFHYVQLIGDYGYLSKQLRWIYWKGFPLKYIPNSFNLDCAIAIDLKYSNLIVLWKKSQVLSSLKILNLSYSKHLIETPDFSGLSSLEKLILKGCSSLRKVHQSIGDLCHLLLINLKDCTSLSNLPVTIYKLKYLKTLILSGCSKIDKLEEEDIASMESLTTLIAENTAVKQVPFSIVRSKSIVYISLCGYEGLSENVFPSIVQSWISPTMNPLSYIHPFCMDMENNNGGDLAPLLGSLSNLRSVLVHCDTEFQLSKQLNTILVKNGVNFKELGISKNHLRSSLIGIGSYKEFFNTLNNSISEGLATSESCDVFLPGDNDPYWLAHMGEGHSVYFTFPEDCLIKGMALCVVYVSTPQIMATECLTSVLMVNYTKCTLQIHKHDTVVSFNDEDWQSIISNMESGDKVEILVTFGRGLEVKKTAVYLMYGESNDMEMKNLPEPKENALIRFIRKIVMCDFS